jgi:3-deoxy-D-manno-octulosonic-acid transferase
MSSTFDVYIVIELAKRLGWTYFHAIFGDRDQSLVDLMEQETSALNMCLATKQTIKMSDVENELSNAVEEMLQYGGATVVMVFIPTPAIEMLLKVAHEKNTFGKLVFIIPKHVENIEKIVSTYSKPSLGMHFYINVHICILRILSSLSLNNGIFHSSCC